MLEALPGEGAFAGALASLVQVLLIDLVLAGDNAVAVGLAAAGLPSEQRRRVILLGLTAAVVMRIGQCALGNRFGKAFPGITFSNLRQEIWLTCFTHFRVGSRC